MSLLVVGLSHRSAPVSVLERASLTADAQVKLLQDTVAAEPAAEAAVLATCNRIELYADVDKFHAGVAELSTLLAQHSGVGLEELTPYLYVHYEDRAVHHLFSVACGLDSMVVGEGQILGQIKDALALGQELHTAGPAAERPVPAGPAGRQARPQRDRHRPGRASPWSPSASSSSPAATDVARLGQGQARPGHRRRLHVLAGRRHPGPRRASPRSSSPTAPPTAPSGSRRSSAEAGGGTCRPARYHGVGAGRADTCRHRRLLYRGDRPGADGGAVAAAVEGRTGAPAACDEEDAPTQARPLPPDLPRRRENCPLDLAAVQQSVCSRRGSP